MSQNFEKYFIKAIEDLKSENRYREFVDIARICGEFPFATNNKNGKKIVRNTSKPKIQTSTKKCCAALKIF